jgi:ADP-heptose:LPS heptosyltransferase
MRKLLLKCHLSPGDIVMLTAAVRDLHRCYPGRFLTGVRTPFPEIWEHNPYLASLADDDPEVEQIDCAYPLIDRCNRAPYHCLHGFIEFLNDRLGLAIRPTVFRGDIHLSKQEKAWFSQVHEVTGRATPFWIVVAGGKYDVTVKWWHGERFQQVIDHFRGKLLFAQVGEWGHHHPPLQGVVDLRGRTNLRELIRLVYHAQGVLSPVTAAMHLGAAVETRNRARPHRPCVVIAGGREPVHWEAYPHHQFLHTIGALPCCADGGCWRDRTMPLRDGDRRDRPENRCADPVDGHPRCMDLITPGAVIHAIELYIQGGAVRPLSLPERAAGERGIRATAANPYDNQPLTLASAGTACDSFVASLKSKHQASDGEGRGIVICGGGVTYFTNAWVCIQMLRRLGCELPVELWFRGRGELDEAMRRLMTPLNVHCVDAEEIRRKHPARLLKTWELKPYALLHSRFRAVLLLDADNVPVVNPDFLFDTPEFIRNGAIFWPDYARPVTPGVRSIWISCGLRPPGESEFETGQIVVDKSRCGAALRLAMWFNEHSDFYYQHIHGDKETFHLAFRKLRQSYALVPHPIQRLDATMCQHDFSGRRIFQHRNADKWDLFLHNRQIKGFWFEKECREYVARLRRVWNARIGRVPMPATEPGVNGSPPPNFEAILISSDDRRKLRERTLRNLARTDWADTPLYSHLTGPGIGDTAMADCLRRALQSCATRRADYVLLLEDDLDFNDHLRHNLLHWTPIRTGVAVVASLYNPRVRETACDLEQNARLVAPDAAHGTQAVVLSRSAVASLLRRWNKEAFSVTDILRLAPRRRFPVFYHAPSLVQHIDLRDDFDPNFQTAMDFSRRWRSRREER